MVLSNWWTSLLYLALFQGPFATWTPLLPASGRIEPPFSPWAAEAVPLGMSLPERSFLHDRATALEEQQDQIQLVLFT